LLKKALLAAGRVKTRKEGRGEKRGDNEEGWERERG